MAQGTAMSACLDEQYHTKLQNLSSEKCQYRDLQLPIKIVMPPTSLSLLAAATDAYTERFTNLQ